MKAAPKKVAESATIVTPDPKGGMRTLRKGTNGFTCMPDNPETPGPDPMCWDKNAGDWIEGRRRLQPSLPRSSLAKRSPWTRDVSHAHERITQH